jgi:hypothetical protein
MSTVSDVIAAVAASGLAVSQTSNVGSQGALVTVPGRAKPIRVYAWEVSDNGSATGVVRSADERRIQASRNKPIDVDPNADTLVLGWCDDEAFTNSPLIVAFNGGAVAARVNAKLERRAEVAGAVVRGSDSQQFRQGLLDKAQEAGIAVGQNQHGESVVAMKPERFGDYLDEYWPQYHSAPAPAPAPTAAPSMQDLVAEAEAELGEPGDEDSSSEPAFDPNAIEDGRERVAREIAVRRGQAGFRQRLLDAYGCCAISGSEVEQALEAAHIVPYQGPGTNHVTNGLLLRADLHTLFDLGLLSIDPLSLTVLVHTDLNGSEYEKLRGQPLKLGRKLATPNQQAMALHRAKAGL